MAWRRETGKQEKYWYHGGGYRYTGVVLVAWRRIQVYRSSVGSMEEDTGIQEQWW